MGLLISTSGPWPGCLTFDQADPARSAFSFRRSLSFCDSLRTLAGIPDSLEAVLSLILLIFLNRAEAIAHSDSRPRTIPRLKFSLFQKKRPSIAQIESRVGYRDCAPCQTERISTSLPATR